MKKSEDGINLVRCIGLFLVFGFHYYLYNGYYYQPQVGIDMLAANVSRALFLSCNGIYMMLTGYLKSDKPINWHYFKCILRAIITYMLAAFVSIPVRHFCLGDKRSFSEWEDAFFSYSGVYYGWYVRMYIGLILISPLMNYAIKGIEDNKRLILVTFLMVAATSFSNATTYAIFPPYWEIAYPLSYYMIGATIKRINVRMKKWQLLLVIALMAFGTGYATLSSTDGTLKEALSFSFGDIWIMLIGLSIFLLFYQAKLSAKASKMVRFIANGAFPAYMLSNLTDAWIYKLIPVWHEPRYYVLGLLLLTIPAYMFWIIIGNGVTWIVDKILNISIKKHKK